MSFDIKIKHTKNELLESELNQTSSTSTSIPIFQFPDAQISPEEFSKRSNALIYKERYEAMKDKIKDQDEFANSVNEIKNKLVDVAVDNVVSKTAELAASAVKVPGAAPFLKVGVDAATKPVVEALKKTTNLATFPKPEEQFPQTDIITEGNFKNTDDREKATTESITNTTNRQCEMDDTWEIHIKQICEEGGLSEEAVQEIISSELAKDRELKIQISDNLQEVNKMMKENRTEAFRESQIEGYKQAIDFLDTLGTETNCKSIKFLANTGKLFMALENGIHLLSGPITVCSAAGAVGIIGGAFYGMVSMFLDAGPNPTELILNKLQSIAERIEELEKSQDKKFDQVFENQKLMMKTISEGFKQLEKVVRTGNKALRADLSGSIEKIQASIDFLTSFSVENATDQYLLGFRDVCAQTDNWLKGNGTGNAEKRILKLSERLANWGAIHSNSGFITGAGVWRAWSNSRDYGVINKHLKFNEISLALCSGIGFLYLESQRLKNTEQKTNANESEGTPIPHPWIWFQALSKYTNLRSRFPQLADSGYQISQLRQAGEEGLAFIQSLQTDESFWNGTIQAYYDSLSEVKECYDACLKEYEQEILNRLNEHRAKSENPQRAIPAFKLMKPSSEFIDQCEGRQVLSLPNGLIPSVPNTETVYLGKLRNKNFIIPPEIDRRLSRRAIGRRHLHINPYEPELVFMELEAAEPLDKCGEWKKRNAETKSLSLKNIELRNKKYLYNSVTISKTLLAAEIMGIISLAVQQKGSIKGLGVSEFIWAPHEGGQGWLRGHNVCKNENGPILTLDPPIQPITINPNDKWTISFNIDAKISKVAHSALKIAFKGNWEGLGGIHLNAEHVDEAETDWRKGTETCYHKIEKDDEFVKWGKHLIEFIEWYWEKSNRPLSATISKGTNLDQMVSEEIEAFFTKERKIFANKLRKQRTSSKLQKFQKALDRLDYQANINRAYLNLMGKEIKDTPFAQMVDSTIIFDELKSYTGSHIDLLSCLNPPVEDKRINFSWIKTLPQKTELIAHHPLRLYENGLNTLSLFQTWEILNKERYPELQRFSTYEEYQIACTSLREEFFAKETYEMFRELNAENFNDAKHQVNYAFSSFEEISAQQYYNIYMTLSHWAIDKSRTSIATGSHVENFRMMRDLSDVKLQQEILHSLPRGWTTNIGYLYEYARKFIPESNQYSWKPANFTMWADGALSLIKVMYDSRFDKVAADAQNSQRKRLITITNLRNIGRDIQAILYTICLSDKLFDSLFNDYIDIVQKIKSGLPLNYNINSIIKELEVCKAQKFGGKKFDVCAYLLSSYLEMMHANYIENVPCLKVNLQIKGAEELIQYLRQEHKAIDKIGIEKMLTDYIADLISIQRDVQDHIARCREQLILWNFLAESFGQEKASSVLKLNGEMFRFGLTPEKCELIIEFLSNNSKVITLEFIEIDLTDQLNEEMIPSFLKKLAASSQVKAIRCVSSKMSDKIKDTAKTLNFTIESEDAVRVDGKRRIDANSHTIISNYFSDKPSSILINNSILKSKFPLTLPLGPNLLTNLLKLCSKAIVSLEEKIDDKKREVRKTIKQINKALARINALQDQRNKSQWTETIQPTITSIPMSALMIPTTLSFTTPSMRKSNSTSPQIIDVPGYKNSCGLFAVACALDNLPQMEGGKVSLFVREQRIAISDGKWVMTDEQAEIIHQFLRQELGKSILESESYKKSIFMPFISTCLNLVNGSQDISEDVKNLYDSNLKFSKKIIDNLKGYFEVDQSIDPYVAELNKISIDPSDVVKTKDALLQSIDSRNFISPESLLANFYTEDESDVRILKLTKHYYMAWNLITQGDEEIKQGIHKTMECYLMGLIIEKIKAVPKEERKNHLLRFGTLISVAFDSLGKIIVHNNPSLAVMNAKYLYLLLRIEKHWDTIYSCYVQHIISGNCQLTEGELSCFTKDLNINLVIQHQGDQKSMSSNFLDNRPTIKLCNYTRNHWQVYQG